MGKSTQSWLGLWIAPKLSQNVPEERMPLTLLKQQQKEQLCACVYKTVSKWAVRYVSPKVTVMSLNSGTEIPLSPTPPTTMESSDDPAPFHADGGVSRCFSTNKCKHTSDVYLVKVV